MNRSSLCYDTTRLYVSTWTHFVILKASDINYVYPGKILDKFNLDIILNAKHHLMDCIEF